MTAFQDTKDLDHRDMGADQAAAAQTFDAHMLLGADGLAQIMLGEQRYLLRLTKAGKLILTK